MNTELNNIFSSNLTYWLNRRKKTQADLYKSMNVSSATASDWCNGKKIPRTDKLLELSRWLMIDLSELLYETGKKEDENNDIYYRMKDDKNFFDLVKILYSLDPGTLQKVIEYANLLLK